MIIPNQTKKLKESFFTDADLELLRNVFGDYKKIEEMSKSQVNSDIRKNHYEKAILDESKINKETSKKLIELSYRWTRWKNNVEKYLALLKEYKSELTNTKVFNKNDGTYLKLKRLKELYDNKDFYGNLF